MNNCFSSQKTLQQNSEIATATKFSGNFIKASKTYIPNQFEEKEVYAEHKKETHFDPIEVTNEALQKSNLIIEKTYTYIEHKEDIEAISDFLKTTGLEYQKSTLQNIWKKLVDANRIDIANHLGVRYLIPIAKQLKDTALVNQLFRFSQTSVGAIAPNFSWKENGKTRWLSDMEGSENYILVFWSSTCSHCLKELPKLHIEMEGIAENKYKVIAFGLEDDIDNWKNVIQQLPLFLHIPGLGKWDNSTATSYDIERTPTYFVLNSDKKITAKPHQLKELIKSLNQ